MCLSQSVEIERLLDFMFRTKLSSPSRLNVETSPWIPAMEWSNRFRAAVDTQPEAQTIYRDN
eukprot:8845012-Heterocapsa_arctica.AAC.1